MHFTTAILASLAISAAALNITVSSTDGNATSPLQYGIMFEDINFSGDGGIYAELIRNRAFQGSTVFPSTLLGWSEVGRTTLSLQNLSEPLSSALPTSLNVAVNGASGNAGFANTGYWGIDVQVQDYTGSFWVKGSYNGSFTASLESDLSNETFGSVQIHSHASADAWIQHNFTLTPTSAASNSNNSFMLTFDTSGVSGGSLDFNLISLFPPTYKDRPNGLRKDLAEALKELNPKFLRCPGGNNLEGDVSPYLWKWNETIGPLKDRPGRPGTWSYENTDGLGLIEYMHWTQDLEIEPILAVWAGYYLNQNETVVSEAEIGVWVQYALDELEFLMGSTGTTYGALRASLGYPEPFQINYVEIGNEDNLGQGNASYSAYRFSAFYDAITAAYPDITVIASTIAVDPFPDHASGDYHEYTRPDNFVSQFGFFDNFTRDHPVLIGEYAVVQPNIDNETLVDWNMTRLPFPIWIGSVSEAVFLIGAERNSDIILGASYAPTFQNLNEWQWAPDLISYTAAPSQDVRSTSWHVIQLLANNLITETLPTSGGDFGPAYWVAGSNNQTGSHLLKIAVYNSTNEIPVSVSFDGLGAGSKATLTVLTAPAADSYNDIGSNIVKSQNTTITASSSGVFDFNLPALSVSVLEVHGSGNGGNGTSTVTSSNTKTSTSSASISISSSSSSGSSTATGTATSGNGSGTVSLSSDVSVSSSSVSTGSGITSGSETSSGSSSTPSSQGGRRGGHGGFGGWTPNNGGWGNCTGRET